MSSMTISALNSMMTGKCKEFVVKSDTTLHVVQHILTYKTDRSKQQVEINDDDNDDVLYRRKRAIDNSSTGPAELRVVKMNLWTSKLDERT